MKLIITVVVAIGVLVCLAAMQSVPDQETINLRAQVADMALRISRLEHAAGAIPGAVDPSHRNASPDNIPRSIVVGGINQGEKRQVDQDEIDDLKSDAASLQDTVDFHLDNQARVAGDLTYYGGRYSDGHYGYNHSNSGRERMEKAQSSMANRYATEAAIKRKKAKRMVASANEELQVINGHDGDVVFTLRTKHDLSLALTDISIGDTVTWGGTRVSADGGSEVWEISSIRKVD